MYSIDNLESLIADFNGEKGVEEYATELKMVHDEFLSEFRAFHDLPASEHVANESEFNTKQLLFMQYEAKIISHLNFQLNDNEHGASAMLTEEIPLTYKDHANLLMPVLTLQNIEEPSKREILAISCAIDEVIARAKVLGNTKFDEKTVIAYVQSILDDASKVAWDFFFPDEPSLEALQNFLIKRSNQLPSSSMEVQPEPKRNPFAGKRQRDDCIRCNGLHPLHRCEPFKLMEFFKRKKFVLDNLLCENCFSPLHANFNCPNGVCKWCNIKHNSLLCPRLKL